ncbi:MAG: sugar phosphate isomerase/epimerase, partial [Anaerolineae bacterium]|nr:sugar phosphate isomerase/epimerase [Anaerolineae bacterium]
DIWRSQACRALEMVAGWAGAPDRIVLENLEGYPIDLLEPIFDQVPVSRCVDIGHLWLDGRDPLPYLFRALDRTRVIHIHGVHHQDHQSLAYVPHNELDRVLATLVEHQYTGILTMEVFGEDDFNSSRTAIYDSLQRLNLEG